MEHFRWVMLIIGILILSIVIWLTRKEQLKQTVHLRKTAAQARQRLGLTNNNHDEDEDKIDQQEEHELKQEIKALKSAILDKSSTEEEEKALPTVVETEESQLNSARFLVKPADQNTIIPESVKNIKDLPERMFIVHIKGKKNIYGKRLMEAFKKTNLIYGEMNIFHYKVEGDILFSVANMVKPGEFNLNKMYEFMTPGITLFMRLPGPRSGRTILVRFLMTIHTLTEELDGIILDEHRQPLNCEDLHNLEGEASCYPAVPTKRKKGKK